MMHRLLSHRHMPLYLAVLAVMLCAPALKSGLLGDDYYLQWVLTDSSLSPQSPRAALNLFVFVPGDEELTRRGIDHGALPWWTHERLRLAFFRPLAGLTHWLDFRLWPSRPWLMHLHSLLWFGAAVAAAGVAYRRLLRPPALAGLAALLYAVDEAHIGPAVWLSARNGSISTFFTLVALMAPAAFVGTLWAIAYRALGYGARHSGMYIDPGTSPLEYARALVERGRLPGTGWQPPRRPRGTAAGLRPALRLPPPRSPLPRYASDAAGAADRAHRRHRGGHRPHCRWPARRGHLPLCHPPRRSQAALDRVA